ncbi:dephospho-CoA kinase [Pricia sp. S334]|uniref:Dephospho-CoA kinase n=1 Tax=Pricia mediterranea TaxID=3076079 RepID=A0ABU3LAI7_9FLAO|nr:dephospho-CoA kinase [Pricia sp. S334]MDT7830692.1 dephospho-CoA kinase [Pricia sp. S334]
MRYVGLTGGIGSGKTTVARLFTELGVPVYNSDNRAKELMESSPQIKRALKALFGKQAYTEKGLNKAFISEQVFNDESLLKKLNSIVHPAVRKDFLAWTEIQDTEYVIQEAAIIFEIGTADFYDQIILVIAPENIRKERVMKRKPETSLASIEARMQNQWKDERKIDVSDYVIQNLDLKDTEQQVLDIHRDLLKNG